MPEQNLARLIFDAWPDNDLLANGITDADLESLEALYSRVRQPDYDGDALFRFVVVEAWEGGEGNPDMILRVLERARNEIESVLDALVDYGAP